MEIYVDVISEFMVLVCAGASLRFVFERRVCLRNVL